MAIDGRSTYTDCRNTYAHRNYWKRTEQNWQRYEEAAVDSYEKLVELLKTDRRFVDDDGELVLAAAQDSAWKMDHALVKLLLSDQKIGAMFFDDVMGCKVFNINTFMNYVSQKSFLDNSYTRFKDRVGLTVDGKFLSERGEVALVWPYKDTVLEGGQTKEQERRKEIFFNEVLAQDEIDRMFHPKVLTNFTRYTAGGKEPVVELRRDNTGTISENLFVKGNNLIALHSLQQQFRERVKLIYIDPPYNRDEESFYNDSFRHSSWLTFMKNRLEMACQLLRQDGCIFISIDDTEQPYLRVLCDEVFGRENFLANIAYERSGVSGLGQGGGFLVNTHESIVCYAKSKSYFHPVDLSGEGGFSKEDMRRYNKYLISVGKRTKQASFIAPSTKQKVTIYRHPQFTTGTISLKKLDERYDEVYAECLSRFESIFRNTSVQEENEFQNKILGYCQDGFYSAEYLVSRGKNKGQMTTAYYFKGQVFAWLKDSAKVG
jgi:adenine-specific DNA-methyltransferase